MSDLKNTIVNFAEEHPKLAKSLAIAAFGLACYGYGRFGAECPDAPVSPPLASVVSEPDSTVNPTGNIANDIFAPK
ncbi:MAG: hypothetical protein WBK77_07555 [Alphaproteobacteria bacterium]